MKGGPDVLVSLDTSAKHHMDSTVMLRVAKGVLYKLSGIISN